MTATTTTNKKRPAPFRDAVIAEVEANSKMQLGENGCPEFSDTGDAILNLSQKVRGANVSADCDAILGSDNVRDVVDLIVLTFLTRNIRGGKGEKDLSHDMFLSVRRHFPKTAKQLLPLFATQYGYWKDLLLLSEKDPALLHESVDLMRAQLQKDLAIVAKHKASPENKGTDPKISLLAKWMPRENSGFDKRLNFVKTFLETEDSVVREGADKWKSTAQKKYRHQVSMLTSFLKIPEVYLSAQREDEMDFGALASKATFKLSRALLNETKDGEIRRTDAKRIKCAELFVEHLTRKGLKGATLMPHEIVAEILKGSVSPMRAKVLDALWKDLWKTVVDQVRVKAQEDGLDFDPTKMVPLSDVSGSMYGTPMEVAIAMGIGISEITHPSFRDLVLTFETKPQWHKLNAGDSIVQKVRSLARARWGGSTNFAAAYDKILERCESYRLAREDVPTMIVFSDMQFDEAYSKVDYWQRGHKGTAGLATMHQEIRSKFATTAQKLGWSDPDPTPIVYWNLRNTGGHPVEKDTEGAVLLSGFSPSMLKMVMTGEALEDKEIEVVGANGQIRTEKVRVTPSEVLRKSLDEGLYDPVRAVLLDSREGILAEYGF